MSDIKILIDYLNPRKHKGKTVGRQEFHLIKIDEIFIQENQDVNSDNVIKIIMHEAPKSYSFTDNFKYISTNYPLYVDNTAGIINYYFQRTQDTGVTYVSLEDVLLSDTNDSHFHELDDQDFQLINQDLIYYHTEQKCLYAGVNFMPEIEVFGYKTLDYNPKELGGLENGTYRTNYKDAQGYTYDVIDRWFSSYFDQRKRNVTVKLNEQPGKLYWYPEIVYENNQIVLYYDYHFMHNPHFDVNALPINSREAIRLEFDDTEGFLGFMMVTYFIKGVSPMSVSHESSFRKKYCFKRYVDVLNAELSFDKIDIDKALTYLYYVPADFFLKKQTLFPAIKDGDNILGADFIWKVMAIAIEDQLTNAGINKEDIILRLLKILKYIQKDEKGEKKAKNDYLLNQLLTRKTKDNLSYLHAFYEKMHTSNFVKYNSFIYSLWRNSSFIDPTNPIYDETSPIVVENSDNTKNKEGTDEVDKNKPRLVFPYKTNELFGFYSSNINTEFNDKGNVVVTPDESSIDNIIKALANVGLGEIIEAFVEEDWEAEYHPLQPVFLADPTNDKAMQLQKLSPMLLVKANEDKSYWANVSTGTEYAFDVLTTISGIGNLAKFRHLARAVQVAKGINKGNKVVWFYRVSRAVKGAAGGIEITAGTVNALLKITGIKNTKFGAALSEFLFWLELLSLSGELTLAINKGLRRNAKKLTNAKNLELLDEGLDELVKKGELDEVGKYKVLKELSKISGTSFDYSARFAKTLKKSSDRVSSKIKNFEQKNKDYGEFRRNKEGKLEKVKLETGMLNNSAKDINIKHSGPKYPSYVDWSYVPDEKFKGSTLTHNHPSGSGLSLADIKMFIYGELRELRAITPNNTVYSIKNLKIDADQKNRLLKFIRSKELSADRTFGDVDELFKDALVFRQVWDEMKDLVEYVQYID